MTRLTTLPLGSSDMPKFIRTLLHRLYLAVMLVPFKLMPSRAYLAFSGEGSTAQLCKHIAGLGAKRVLVVTDKPLVELGLVGRATDALRDHGVETVVYDGILPDPTFSMVEAGLALQRQHQCDAVLAMGGGSSIDTAKTIAAAAANGGDARKLVGYFKVKAAALPLYAIPTTAGTGSEVTIAAIVSDSDTHEKFIVADPKLLPQGVALDPSLMTGLPPAITAATGIDALTHAVETYISQWATDKSADYSRAATKMIFEHLPTAYRDGGNIAAREQMALAAYYAGLAINDASVGNVHAIAHQFGRHYSTPHGLANAIAMPHVLRFSKRSSARGLAELAQLIGVAVATDSVDAAADKFIDAVSELNRSLGIPETLDALKPEDVAVIAVDAVKEGAGYPVPILMSRSECEAMLRQMLGDSEEAVAASPRSV